MIIFPWRERFIFNKFIENAFDETDESPRDYKAFTTLGSAEQYYLASIYNWDEGVDVLKWIVQSPKCDKGTAGLIFWSAEPDFYINAKPETLPSYEREVFNLLQLITLRFNNSDFKTSYFKYEPGYSIKHINFNARYEEWTYLRN